MHFRFNFEACAMHSFLRPVHLTHQNLSASELICYNLLTKDIHSYKSTNQFQPRIDFDCLTTLMEKSLELQLPFVIKM